MEKLINLARVPSLMEQRARLFRKREKPIKLSLLPATPEETEKELRNLGQVLKSLSGDLGELRGLLREKEKQFSLFANYKYFLEKTLITPTLITLTTSKRKRDKTSLLRKLEALTPEQLKKLKDIKL